MAIPGTRLLAFVARWFDAATVSRVFEPLAADWQREWVDASPSQRARVRLRGTIAFAIAALVLTPRAVFAAPSPPSMTRRVLSRIIIFTSIVSAVLTIPILMESRRMTPFETIVAALFIQPAGVVIALPFSMIWAADGIRRASAATPAERAAALRFGVIAVVFMVGLAGWGVPLMNRLYREVAAPEWVQRPLANGVREATLGELFAKQPPRFVDARSPAALQRERTNRSVLAVLPAVLLWLRFSASDDRRHRRWLRPPVAIDTVLAIAIFFPLYFSSLIIEIRAGLEPGIAMWLPIAALIVAGVTRNRLTRGISHA